MDMQTQPIVDAVPAQASMPESRTAAASRARTRHGLYGKYAVVPGESMEAFLAFRHDMLACLLPVTPVEAAVAEQMVMAQWKPQHLWTAETGVYLAYEEAHPNKGAAHPVRLSAVLNWDWVEEDRQLDRLSLQQLRLVNIFHKGITKLALIQDQRSKGIGRPQDRFESGERIAYERAETAPAPAPGESPASPSNEVTSGENADRGEAAVGAAPAPSQATEPAAPTQESLAPQEPASPTPTASSHAGSGEIADREPLLAPAGPSSPASSGGEPPAPTVDATPAKPAFDPPQAEAAPSAVSHDAPLDDPHLGPDDIPNHFAPPMTRREIQRLESADNRWRAAVNKARVR